MAQAVWGGLLQLHLQECAVPGAQYRRSAPTADRAEQAVPRIWRGGDGQGAKGSSGRSGRGEGAVHKGCAGRGTGGEAQSVGECRVQRAPGGHGAGCAGASSECALDIPADASACLEGGVTCVPRDRRSHWILLLARRFPPIDHAAGLAWPDASQP